MCLCVVCVIFLFNPFLIALVVQVLEFAAAYPSYSLLGHSQGGMVSLNILNTYHTGVDAAVGERKVQSLQTPYYGNGAASSADTMKTVSVLERFYGANNQANRMISSKQNDCE